MANPEWMERAAEKGRYTSDAEYGIMNLQKQLELKREEKAIMKELGKYDKATWANIALTIRGLGGLKSGTDLDFIQTITNSIKDTIKTELDAALSPLKNELMGALNEIIGPLVLALEPVLNAISPYIKNIAEFIGFGIRGIIAAIKGEFDEFRKSNDPMVAKIWDLLLSVNVALIENKIIQATGMTYAELNQQGTAGGVYSGQFDIDLDTLAQQLANLGLPTYTEEE